MRKAICRRDILGFKKGNKYPFIDGEVYDFNNGLAFKPKNINRYFRIKGAM